jgi:hypothetical protein
MAQPIKKNSKVEVANKGYSDNIFTFNFVVIDRALALPN